MTRCRDIDIEVNDDRHNTVENGHATLLHPVCAEAVLYDGQNVEP